MEINGELALKHSQVKFVTLTYRLAERIAEALVALDAARFEVGWTTEQVFADLQDKWQFSVVALDVRQAVVGFAIASRFRQSNVHVHCIVVAEQVGNQGIGKALLEAVADRATGCNQMILESPNQPAAAGFYHAVGFQQLSVDNIKQYLAAKGKVAQQSHYLPIETCTRLVFVKPIPCTSKPLL